MCTRVPAEASIPETEPMPTTSWLDLNRIHAEPWPSIVTRKAPLLGADAKNGRIGNLAALSPKPATNAKGNNR